MATNNQTIEHFINKENGNLDGENLLTNDGTLYSYGLHWPLAAWNGDEVCVNGDRRSQKSTIHVGLITQALTKAGIPFRTCGLKELKDLLDG